MFDRDLLTMMIYAFLVQGVVLVIHRDQLSLLFYARSSEPRDI